jgi:small subunit ribosomal protein S15Ae
VWCDETNRNWKKGTDCERTAAYGRQLQAWTQYDSPNVDLVSALDLSKIITEQIVSHSQKDQTLTYLFAVRLATSSSQRTGYIGEFEIIDDHRAGKIVIELTGRLNKCGVISPRFDVEYGELEKWTINLLPSRQFGHILISTSQGIMTHEEARRKKTGGKILGFFY